MLEGSCCMFDLSLDPSYWGASMQMPYITSKRHRGVEYFGLFLDSFIEERPEIFTRIAFSLIGSDESEPNNEVERPSQR